MKAIENVSGEGTVGRAVNQSQSQNKNQNQSQSQPVCQLVRWLYYFGRLWSVKYSFSSVAELNRVHREF